MRPIRVEFQAFGPYAYHETVDFEALSSQGLFLICGKTGIGKTMILDAVTFALYGKSSGHGRDSLEAMRCTNAGYDQPTFVSFTFENQGRLWRFERRLERKRKNLSASCSLMEKRDDSWEVVFENPKEKALNEKAAEIIGLDYDQFRQVIVLPQGQFERLLTANSDEKEKILTTIFGEEKWQRIAELFYAEAEERKNRLRDAREGIRRSLLEEQCETLSELSLLIGRKRNELKELEEEYRKADYDKTIREQQELLTLCARFSDLKKAGEKAAELLEQKEERKVWEQRSSDARRSEIIRPFLTAVQEARRALKKREEEEKAAGKLLEQRQKALAEAAEGLALLMKRKEEAEEKRSLKLRLEGKRKDYEGIKAAEEEYGKLKRTEEEALRSEQNAKKRLEGLKAAILSRQEAYQELQKEHDALLYAYLSGITGELAAQLKEGEPCPVCGSTDHPKKAKSKKNSVRRDMVDEKKAASDRKYKELQDVMAEQEKAKEEVEKIRRALEEARTKTAAAESRLQEMKKNLVEEIGSLHELEERIRRLDTELRSFDEEKASLEKEELKTKDACTEAKARIEAAGREKREAGKSCEAAVLSLKERLKEQGFAGEEEAEEMLLPAEELLALNSRIASYDAALEAESARVAELEKELQGKQEPEEEKCRELLDGAVEAKSAYGEKRGILSSEIQRLEKKNEKLLTEGAGIEERIREAEEDFAFAKGLRGDSGIGLQRYVLGIMFSHVVAEANRMLEMVHGGRYRLFRSDEKAQGTNKRGLELKVFDKNSPDPDGRFVGTLSGGEKFLASLALSIGMSAVAQHSGIRIEALFIDEGFGSLDEDSIDDAMNVLKSIQEANGMVGLISHVQLLQDQIPNKLCIVEDEKGSHIVQSIG